jgi:hypothetical protein
VGSRFDSPTLSATYEWGSNLRARQGVEHCHESALSARDLLSTNQHNASHFDIDRDYDIRRNGTDLELEVINPGTVVCRTEETCFGVQMATVRSQEDTSTTIRVVLCRRCRALLLMLLLLLL